ncbi:hypothetical protein JCM8547_004440 [Rhodosporidiobolus lusitaniae]
MHSETFGYLFAAQQAFTEECAGGTLAEYCAAANDNCCGVCQNIPVTGMGTFLSFVFGTLLNLGFALHFKVETPYTLAFQLLGTDAIVLSLLDRLLEPENKLTLFHYCWIPMSAMSVVPIVAACSMARLKYLHAFGTAAERELRMAMQDDQDKETRQHDVSARKTSVEALFAADDPSRPRPNLTRDDTHAHFTRHERQRSDWAGTAGPPVARRNSYALGKPSKARPSMKGLRRITDLVQTNRPAGHNRDLAQPSSASRPGLRSRSSQISEYDEKVHKRFPNPRLPGFVLWVTLAHLIAYVVIFACVYGLVDVDSVSQANCVSEYHLQTWRIGMGLFVLTMALIWLAFWFVLHAAIKGTHKINGKRVEGSQIVVHNLSRVFIWLPHAKKGEDGKKDWESNWRFTNKDYLNRWRFGMSLAVYAVWAIPYATLYFIALNRFLLMGANPWPFEQVNAAFGIITPLALVARAVIDSKDGWSNKERMRLQKEYILQEERRANSISTAMAQLRRRDSLRREGLPVDDEYDRTLSEEDSASETAYRPSYANPVGVRRRGGSASSHDSHDQASVDRHFADFDQAGPVEGSGSSRASHRSGSVHRRPDHDEAHPVEQGEEEENDDGSSIRRSSSFHTAPSHQSFVTAPSRRSSTRSQDTHYPRHGSLASLYGP